MKSWHELEQESFILYNFGEIALFILTLIFIFAWMLWMIS